MHLSYRLWVVPGRRRLVRLCAKSSLQSGEKRITWTGNDLLRRGLHLENSFFKSVLFAVNIKQYFEVGRCA
jgi:hypothetical protein